jgi:hypothetical protein
MKQLAILLFILSTRISAQNYFPLQVGNSWTYCGSSDTVHKRTYQVTDTARIADKTYFLYGLMNFDKDTVRNDLSGHVWKLSNGVENLWFDFTKDSGDVYTFPQFGTYVSNVKVSKHVTVKTHNGTYSNCVHFDFDIPQIIDDEISYTFALGIGLIKKGGAWSDDLLYGAIINGVPLEVAEYDNTVPSSFVLKQNYPNPFNPSTIIDYELQTASFVTLSVFDMLGREIATLVNKQQSAGKYRVDFDGRNLMSGVYLYSLRSGNHSIIRKCVLLK